MGKAGGPHLRRTRPQARAGTHRQARRGQAARQCARLRHRGALSLAQRAAET